MKNLIVSIVSLVVLVSSCSMNGPETDYLSALEIEVPEQLQDNAEVMDFIESSTQTINTWSVKFEDLLVACEPYVDKTEEELSVMDKLKLGKITMEFMANMGQFAVKVAEIEKSTTMIEDGLNEEELKAFALIVNKILIRIDEIDDKYKYFGNEESEELQIPV